MNKLILIFLIPLFVTNKSTKKVIERQGKVSFFSYTAVEHIKAENNQVLSIIDLENGKIAVSMLMNAFIFEKELMREHFNESYVESDIYPKATFEGKINDFDAGADIQTKVINGTFTMHGASKNIDIKVKIEKQENNKYIVSGKFEAQVNDYNIKIPPLLRGNIAKTILVDFNFEYNSYDK